MTSLAVYRVAAQARYGTSPYEPGSGCSLSNLAVARQLAAVGSLALCALYIWTLVLARTVINDHSTDLFGPGAVIIMANQPGVVIMGLATATALVGAITVALAARNLRDVAGVGGPPVKTLVCDICLGGHALAEPGDPATGDAGGVMRATRGAAGSARAPLLEK